MYAKELPAFKCLTICSYQKVTIMNFYDMRKSHQPQYDCKMYSFVEIIPKILNTIKCDVCGFSTKYSGMMSRHKRQAHNNGHLYHCDVCNKSFNHHCKVISFRCCFIVFHDFCFSARNL